ncbi:nucleoside 2-deoxyribosyltransferase [Staphylococcus felis]|nr:nucleoside 2-deoxyribosyltransferase [Staphylococcus felis]
MAFNVWDRVLVKGVHTVENRDYVRLFNPVEATITAVFSDTVFGIHPEIYGANTINTTEDEVEFIKRASDDVNMIYLAGDMLSSGAQLQRKKEATELRKRGLELYVPHEDESINDKANVDNERLAERIVENDTDGIMKSDAIVIDCNENGKGTLVELGQIKGMRDMATLVERIIETYTGFDDSVVDAVLEVCEEIKSKKVYPHNTDIRRQNTAEQQGDRREFGVNQYVYGVALDLTDGKGFYELDEIYSALGSGSNE